MTVITRSGELKKLTPADPDFIYFVSTEGEFGIMVEVTLKLRDVPAGFISASSLFPERQRGLRFHREICNKTQTCRAFNPNVIRFLDENHLSDTNEIMHAGIFKKSAGVLMEFGSARRRSEVS